MKIDNINPVGLEWQEVVGNVSLWERTNRRHRRIIGEYNFQNRSERKDAMNKLNRQFRPYLRPTFFYWVVSLTDPLEETESYSFNPHFYDSNNA
jgi:hypothetical protein